MERTIENDWHETPGTLRRIAEDAYLLAENIRAGGYMGEDPTQDDEEREALRQWRIIELVVNLGERIVQVAGIDPETIWTPDGIRDLL